MESLKYKCTKIKEKTKILSHVPSKYSPCQPSKCKYHHPQRKKNVIAVPLKPWCFLCLRTLSLFTLPIIYKKRRIFAFCEKQAAKKNSLSILKQEKPWKLIRSDSIKGRITQVTFWEKENAINHQKIDNMLCQLYHKMRTTIGILPKEMQQKISMLKDENTKLQVIRHRNYPINYFHACILSFSKINSKKIISTKNAKSCTQFKFLVHSTQITPAQWSLVLIIHSVGPIMDRPLTTNLCMHWAKLPIELMVIFLLQC